MLPLILCALSVIVFCIKTAITRWRSHCHRSKMPSIYPSAMLSQGFEVKSNAATYDTQLSRNRLKEYKLLYHKLHNLDSYPEVLPQCRSLLLQMLSSAMKREKTKERVGPSILDIENYTDQAVDGFVQANNDRISTNFEKYLGRRKQGQPRDLFQDEDEARQWLNDITPVRLVDGAWLGHINKVNNPYKMASPARYLWQVLSEELGDGDVSKNHVAVFTDLLEKVGLGRPDPQDAAFIDDPNGSSSPEVWESALAQLLISLFPLDFFPEILGFNLQFELMTMETLKAAKELAEVKVDPYYFILHVTIDNIDSGHGAIASKAVHTYLDAVLEQEGEESMRQAWKRVQSGYIFSENAPTCPQSSPCTLLPVPREQIEHDLGPMIVTKAKVSHGIHASSKCKLAGRALKHWLEPSYLSDQQNLDTFMKVLSNAKPWVKKGKKESSKLYQELTWGGKMFGSFTRSEVALVGQWIDSLDWTEDAVDYWQHVGDRTLADIPASISLSDQLELKNVRDVLDSSKTLKTSDRTEERLNVRGQPVLSRFLPLWLAHGCLLEGFVAVPARAATVVGCAATRFLRAQAGLLLEGEIVDGMDEACRQDTIGIMDIGVALAQEHMNFIPDSLDQVLDKYPSRDAQVMLQLSSKPVEHRDMLLGMAWAFVNWHQAILSQDLITGKMKSSLEQITVRQTAALQTCVDQLKYESGCLGQNFSQGNLIGKSFIEACYS